MNSLTIYLNIWIIWTIVLPRTCIPTREQVFNRMKQATKPSCFSPPSISSILAKNIRSNFWQCRIICKSQPHFPGHDLYMKNGLTHSMVYCCLLIAEHNVMLFWPWEKVYLVFYKKTNVWYSTTKLIKCDSISCNLDNIIKFQPIFDVIVTLWSKSKFIVI